jgi:CCR4-NOT transcription complex subunit 1
MFVNDNIDTVCRLVEQAAEDHSLAEIDLQLQQAIDERRQHNEQRPNEPFSQTPVSRWSTLIPEPYRQDQNGLNRQQLALYEEFGRQARIPAATHINQTSQDGQRALPDVLGEGYLPSLPTPAEVPAMPRAQGGRLPMQAGHPAHVNGFVDATNIGERIVAMMQELQHASREATEEHVGEVGEGAPIRRIYGQLLGLIESAPQMESTVLASAHHCLAIIYGEPQKRLEVEVFVRLLTQLCRLSPPACRAITMSIATAEEDRIFSPWATIALQAEGLIDIPHIDSLISKGLHARRHIALGFFRDVLEELLLNEHATALRTDFILSYEALSQWLHEENDLDTARDIMAKLQTPASHINGMPSPESETTKQDQNEYIFEEWIKLQRKDVPHRACLGMISQLHDKGVLSGPDSTLLFIRTCLEYSCSAFERISNTPYGTQDQAYIAIDALAKMIATLILYQSPVDAEPPANKVKSFEAFIRLVILVLMDTHNKQRERWNGRVYFRFFSTLLCEFHCGRDLLTPEQDQDLYKSFATALLVLQPKYLPGFAFHWLGLLSHRLLLPSYLVPAGRTNGGWNTFTKLLITLFSSLGEMMAIPEAPAYAQDYYRSVLRFFTMLHHDCPEYLVENHMQLNASIPSQCFQLHNIINSAATRSVYPDQPDPFTPGLKINRLEHVRQAPAIHSDIDNVLDEGGIKSIMEHICTANELSDPDFATVLAVVDRQDGYVSSILVNALVLYVGVHATSASSVFSSGAAPARLLIRLLSESRAEARYWIVSAMTNQVRYVNAHTHYFSTALQHIFNLGQSGVQEQIMRVLCERLMVPRPHPWGLIVMMLEMVKNQAYNIWDLPWVKAAPQIEAMLVNLAQSQEPRLVRSPSGMM